MSFSGDYSSRTYYKESCKDCNKVIAVMDNDWIDGCSDIFCFDCFKKRGYPLEKKIYINNEGEQQV